MIKRHYLRDFLSLEAASALTLGSFCMAFLALIGLRLVVEFSLSGFPAQSLSEIFFTFAHTLLFFLFSFLLFLPLLSWSARLSAPQAATLLLFGFLTIPLTPIIDKLIFGSEFYWSFYSFDSLHGLLFRYFTLFGDNPRIGITYGTRIEVAVITLALMLYIYTRTRSSLRTLGSGVLIYSVFFLLGTFPSWITYLILSPHLAPWHVQASHIAQYFLSPESILGRDVAPFRSALSQKMGLVYALLVSGTSVVLFARLSGRSWRALLSNLRFPQTLSLGGIVILGMILAFIFERPLLQFDFFDALACVVLFLGLGLSWITAIIINDIADVNIDRQTNRKRPLPSKTIPLPLYKELGWITFFFSLLFAGLVSFQALLLTLGYHALSWLYSLPPFRLKRIPLLATSIVALASIVLLSIGYVCIAPSHSLAHIPSSLLIFLFVAYTLALPLKDFKDIKGDAADGVFTIPVLLGVEKARFAMSIIVFLLFIMSVYFLHAPELYVWALFCGTLAFWVIQRTARSRFAMLSFRYLYGWIFTIVTLYGVGLFLFLR